MRDKNYFTHVTLRMLLRGGRIPRFRFPPLNSGNLSPNPDCREASKVKGSGNGVEDRNSCLWAPSEACLLSTRTEVESTNDNKQCYTVQALIPVQRINSADFISMVWAQDLYLQGDITFIIVQC